MSNTTLSVLLLQRSDIDASVKDFEGYIPFDVYNATVEGTKPSPTEPRDLYTWGTNRFVACGAPLSLHLISSQECCTWDRRRR